MRRVIWSIIVILMSSAPALSRSRRRRSPVPEHRKLEYLVGKWTTTGEMKPSPMGPQESLDERHVRVVPGRICRVCHGQGTGPTGPSKNMGVMGYSTDQKSTRLGVSTTPRWR